MRINALLLFFTFSLVQVTSYCQNFNNYSDVGLSFDSLNLSPLDGEIDKYNFIVVGEAHYHDENQVFQFGLFKYLNENFGIRHIVLEMNEALTIFINKFLETGDRKYLRVEVLNQDQFVFYKLIKDYNDSLPINKKITFHGVDYIKSVEIIEDAINELINKVISEGKLISQNSKRFKDSRIDTYDDAKIIGKCLVFLNELTKDSRKYKTEFGNNYESLLRIYESIKANIQKVKYNSKAKHEPMRDRREKLIYEQMLSLKKQYPNEKFYGIYGAAHTPLKKHKGYSRISNFEPFVSKLNTYSESPFTSKILSIKCIYDGKLYDWKKKNQKNNFGLTMEEMEELDKKSKNNLTLFKYPTANKRQKEFSDNYYQYILISKMYL